MRPGRPAGLARLLAGAWAACWALSACGSPQHPVAARHPRRPLVASTRQPTTTLAPTTTTTLDPGSLPQTTQEPTDSDPMFLAGVQDLWQAIVSDDPQVGLPFFFPLSAYLQVKAISDPAADYQNRLIAAYFRDIHAAHQSLGPGAAQAEFAGISVPPTAHWVPPGREYNKIGYWQVLYPVIHYREGAASGQLSIYSLISWRGEWYIVHFGPPTG